MTRLADMRRHAAAAATAALALPVGAGALIARPAWRRGLAQRLGGGGSPSWSEHEEGAEGSAPETARRVWVHGASAGEALLCARLLRALRARGARVLGSTTTLTGRDVLAGQLPELRPRLAPLDHPWCVARALDRAGPDALVLVETELWPAWIAAAARRGIPVAVVSARLSERSHRRYRALGAWWARRLSSLAAVGARTETDAERFADLGVPHERIRVTGDLKLEPGEAAAEPEASLARFLNGVSYVVAGSTHPGEEAILADALEQLARGGLRPAVVVAPRHLERCDAVERELQQRGHRVSRRSCIADGVLGEGEVLLLDRFGELASVYGRAVAAFVGGGFAPVGGHNPVEPVVEGCPACIGPGIEAVAEAVEALEVVGAVTRVHDASELAAQLGAALRDPSAARERAARGREVLGRHRGAVDRTVELLEAAWSGAPLPGRTTA